MDAPLPLIEFDVTEFDVTEVMVSAPEWLAIIDDEIKFSLSPSVLFQIEKNILEANLEANSEIIYKLNSQKLLQVLASSLGMASLRQGAIVIWTYYNDLDGSPDLDTDVMRSPILRTLLNIDGKLSQKVCLDILSHPLGDRILQAHSYLVGQVSRQFVTAIADYVEAKLRPFTIATISMATAIAWCDPLQKLGQKYQLPDVVIANCWSLIIAAPIVVLLIWWINSRLSLRLPSLPKSAQQFGQFLLKLLESRAFQIVAIASIAILLISWLVITFGHLPINGQLSLVIRGMVSYVEPYLPVAIISLRKLIVSALGKIFFKYSFFVKLIFGRFI